MSEPEPLPEPIPLVPPTWPPWAERWVLPYMRRMELWPVLLALLGHLSLPLSGALLLGVVDRNPAGWAALWVFGSGSFLLVRHEWRAEGRPGVVSATLAVLWSIAGALCWAAARYGLW